jgi:anti-sigma B factor antagonist
MSTPSAKLLVFASGHLACVKIVGRANFTSSIDFKTLLNELLHQNYACLLVDLSECVLMDSTFLGVLAQFGLKTNPANTPGKNGIELLNPNVRVAELLENLGALQLFQIINGTLQLPDDVKTCTLEPTNPTHEEITRTSLEAHQTLMAVNPENIARFKDVTQFLAEDLKNLKKCP